MLLSMTLLTACSAAPPSQQNDTTTPPATAHNPSQPAGQQGERTTRFEAKVDLAPLLEVGCVTTQEGLDCTGGSLKRLACLKPSSVEDALGALTPAAGIAECNTLETGGLDEG